MKYRGAARVDHTLAYLDNLIARTFAKVQRLTLESKVSPPTYQTKSSSEIGVNYRSVIERSGVPYMVDLGNPK